MTTIAYKNGVMAADTREVHGAPGHEVIGDCTKLIRFHDVNRFCILVGMAGDSAASAVVAQAIVTQARTRSSENADFWSRVRAEVGDRVKDADFSVLVFSSSTEQLVQVDAMLEPLPVSDPFWAIGSGAKIALGAMEYGASAVEAVDIACKFDPYTGGKIQSYRAARLT
jgi:ATP-dependent protease HslVU (ClpYQ) peptidase subunit